MKENNNIQLGLKKNSKLLGHQMQKDLLINNFKQKRLSHAWIVAGTKSIGKATMVYSAISEMIQLTSPANDELKLDSHPDLYVINKDYSDGKATEINVEDVRKIQEFVSLKSMLTGHKYIVIDPCDDLNLNAGNALLKLLEEAPDNTYYFLVTHNMDKILLTIRSRCNVLELKDLSDNQALEVCKQQLGMVNEENIRKYLNVAGNAPGLAMKMYNYNGLEIYADMLALLAKMPEIDLDLLDQITSRVVAKDSNLWEIFTFFYGLVIQRLIKLSLKIDPGAEIVFNEYAILKKLINKQDIKDFLFIAESADSLIRSTELSYLDKKQIILVLVELLKDSTIK